jgi:hypothetical protein
VLKFEATAKYEKTPQSLQGQGVYSTTKKNLTSFQYPSKTRCWSG